MTATLRLKHHQSSGWKSTPPLNQLTYILDLINPRIACRGCRASTLPAMGWGGSRGEGKGTRRTWHAMMLGRQWTRTNKTVSHSFSQSADTGVSFRRRSFTQITVWPAHMVGCQSKSQGTRYCLGLIAYDIVAVKIFDRYRNIALSIRALLSTLFDMLPHCEWVTWVTDGNSTTTLQSAIAKVSCSHCIMEKPLYYSVYPSLHQQVVMVGFGPPQPATWSYHAGDG